MHVFVRDEMTPFRALQSGAGDGEFVAHSAPDHARDLTASWLAPVTDMDTDTRGVSDPADGRGAGYARRGRGRSRLVSAATPAAGRSAGGTERRPSPTRRIAPRPWRPKRLQGARRSRLVFTAP